MLGFQTQGFNDELIIKMLGLEEDSMAVCETLCVHAQSHTHSTAPLSCHLQDLANVWLPTLAFEVHLLIWR